MTCNSAFIICTERGPLELMSTLLAKSLRVNGGIYADIPIYSIAPRKNFFLSQKRIDALSKLGVTHFNLPLNRDFPYYSLANKPLVCAYVENNFKHDHLVFLDSDILVLSEPLDLFNFGSHDLLIRPVHMQHVGLSEDSDAGIVDYWNKLFEIGSGEIAKEIVTTVDQKKIRAYFNAGVISVKSNIKLFKKWKEILEKAMYSKVAHNGGTYFVEQSTFAIAVASLNVNYGLLDLSYNYPLNLDEALKKVNKNKKLDDVVLLHYHGFSNLDLAKIKTNPFFKGEKKQNWLVSFALENRLETQMAGFKYHQIKKRAYELFVYLKLRYIP